MLICTLLINELVLLLEVHVGCLRFNKDSLIRDIPPFEDLDQIVVFQVWKILDQFECFTSLIFVERGNVDAGDHNELWKLRSVNWDFTFALFHVKVLNEVLVILLCILLVVWVYLLLIIGTVGRLLHILHRRLLRNRGMLLILFHGLWLRINWIDLLVWLLLIFEVLGWYLLHLELNVLLLR